MASEDEFEDADDRTAIHANKRELLRKGMRSGELHWEEIKAVLPREYISDVEIEMFVFTCEQLGIRILLPQAAQEEPEFGAEAEGEGAAPQAPA